MAKKKKKSKANASSAAAAANRGILGPDYVQILTGTLLSKSVSLILCGESHHDAIDVTRAGGGKVKEGWVDVSSLGRGTTGRVAMGGIGSGVAGCGELVGEMVAKLVEIDGIGNGDNDSVGEGETRKDCPTRIRARCNNCKTNNKIIPLGKAKEWGCGIAKDEIDYIEHGHEFILLWAPSKDTGKGKAHVMEFFLEEYSEIDGEEKEDKSRKKLAIDVVSFLEAVENMANSMLREIKSSLSRTLSNAIQKSLQNEINNSSHPKINDLTILQWTDLDSEARALNHRRILGEEISTLEHDTLISQRSQQRKTEENIWMWDEWLLEMKSKLNQEKNGSNGSGDTPDDLALHIVIEAPIPPWEVELCQDIFSSNEDGTNHFELSPAADCIRCLSEDSDESTMDAHDPSSDGFGSYLDYVYRRLLGVEMIESGISQELISSADGENCDNKIQHKSRFLHCVECRDIGCEFACVDDSLHKHWMDLLKPEERMKWTGPGPESVGHIHHKDGRYLYIPDWEHMKEDMTLDELKASGRLKIDNEQDDGPEEAKEDLTLVTFPSFENFFGQSTDIIYYSPHTKVSYGPFLGQCVQSFGKWDAFFSALFFGGTVKDALSTLDLSSDKRKFMHIRSPILQYWNGATGEYEFQRRNDDEHNLTLSLLPVKCFLKAKGSHPARTWSSDIFASLQNNDNNQLKELSDLARKWVMDDIRNHCQDPKLSDDPVGGGEWFLAYLREAHRDVYDDIDHSDPGALLSRKYAAGESCGTAKKYKIGEISIPSCREGFEHIDKGLKTILEEKSCGTPSLALNKEAEVMAKIVIDIYMSKLVDFATVLKIAQVISRERKDKVVIVCYMGSLHTRAVSEFFTNHFGFRKKMFFGKQDWDEGENRIIHFPSELWNLRAL